MDGRVRSVEPSAIELTDFGHRDRLLRVESRTDCEGAAIVGRYRHAASGTSAEIMADGKVIEMRTSGRFGTAVHRLTCVSEEIWNSAPQDPLALPPWSVLVFDRRHTGFCFSNVLTRNLPFQRVQ